MAGEFRVVVTAHSGVHKTDAIQRVCNYIQRVDPDAQTHIIDVERELKSNPGFRTKFLYNDDVDTQYSLWNNSFQVAVKNWRQIKDRPPKFTFLLVHLSYHSQSEFFSALEWAFPRAQGTKKKRDFTTAATIWGIHLLDGLFRTQIFGLGLPSETKRNLADWTGRKLEQRTARAQSSKLVSDQPLLAFLRNEFKPNLFVNLYDNVFSAAHAITTYHFRVGEIMKWRALERGLTDLVANVVIPEQERTSPRSMYLTEVDGARELKTNKAVYPYEASPAVAVNHPVVLLYRLISQPEVPRVYLSFPISRPRADPSDSFMREINHFRRTMAGWFVAFDPLTIDEKPLETALAAHIKEVMTATSKENWLEHRNSILAASGDDIHKALKACAAAFRSLGTISFSPSSLPGAWVDLCSTYSEVLAAPNSFGQKDGPDNVALNFDELFEICVRKDLPASLEGRENISAQSEIEHQITSRDHRLIDQADCVVIYRPMHGKSPGQSWGPGGTYNEADYAVTRDRPLVVIVDKSDPPLGRDGPLPDRVSLAAAQNLISEPLETAAGRERAFERAKDLVLAVLKEEKHFKNVELRVGR